MKKITAEYLLTGRETKLLAGKFLEEKHIKVLINEDCLVSLPSGKTIAIFKKNYIEPQILYDAYINMLPAATRTNNRGTASGGEMKNRILQDGTISKTTQTYVPGTEEKMFVNSGIAGYFDRGAHFDYCRTTAFTRQNLEKYEKCLPLVNVVNQAFKEMVPNRYKKQRAMALATHPNFVIDNTAFTTITINRDYRTAVHTDAGDYAEGFGNLVAYTKNIGGAYFVMPQYGVGFKMRTNDLLLADVHQWHGNTPLKKKQDAAVRLSFVMYYRNGMIKCGSPSQELKRQKLNTTAVHRKYIGRI